MVMIVLFCLPAVAFTAGAKYEVTTVTDGGSIEGTVMFAGATIPKDETVTLTSEQELCGNTLPAQKYLINSSKQIKNVVVFIEAITAGKPFPKKPVVVDNKKCAFDPHVAVSFRAQGSKITYSNSDPVFHNVHSYIKGKTVVNLGLPKQGSTVTKPVRKSGVMEVKCDSHPWMLGYVYVLRHPYGTVTDEKGSFALSDIPPGTYNISAWHEALGTVKMEGVKVEAGKARKIKVEFK
jgi:plastocyanin